MVVSILPLGHMPRLICSRFPYIIPADTCQDNHVACGSPSFLHHSGARTMPYSESLVSSSATTLFRTGTGVALGCPRLPASSSSSSPSSSTASSAAAFFAGPTAAFGAGAAALLAAGTLGAKNACMPEALPFAGPSRPALAAAGPPAAAPPPAATALAGAEMSCAWMRRGARPAGCPPGFAPAGLLVAAPSSADAGEARPRRRSSWLSVGAVPVVQLPVPAESAGCCRPDVGRCHSGAGCVEASAAPANWYSVLSMVFML